MNSFNPELQLKDAESAIKNKQIELLSELRSFRFVTTSVLVFKEIEGKDEIKYDNFYLSSKAEVIINKINIENVFKKAYTTIIANTQKFLGKGSGLIIDSVIEHTISMSKYNLFTASSYIKACRSSAIKNHKS